MQLMKVKIWDKKNYKPIFEHFTEYKFLLFVFGKKELELAEKTFLEYPNCEIVAQHLSFTEQLSLINKLPVFLTMDSANMHLGSLTNTKSNFYMGTNSSIFRLWTFI